MGTDISKGMVIPPEQFERPVNSRIAAEFIGIHFKTLEEMSRRGEVPAAKIGKEWLYLLSLLSIWLSDQMKANLFQPTKSFTKELQARTNEEST